MRQDNRSDAGCAGHYVLYILIRISNRLHYQYSYGFITEGQHKNKNFMKVNLLADNEI
jgi:hypothetical protein